METASAQSVTVTDDLSAQLEALKAKNFELINERRKDKENREKLQQQLDSVQAAQKQAQDAKLAESGEYKTLWEDAQQTITTLKQQLTDKESEVEQIRQGYSKEPTQSVCYLSVVECWCISPGPAVSSS